MRHLNCVMAIALGQGRRNDHVKARIDEKRLHVASGMPISHSVVQQTGATDQH